MGTIADKLNRLINTKEGIRQEINRAYNTEEISTSDTFNSYIQKLEEHPYYLKMLVEGSIEIVKITNVTSIGNNTFSGCGNLIEASFPNATSIGGWAFQNCSSLPSVSFPNVTSIGNSAFHSCSSLTSVSIPNATSIGGSAFNQCSSLTSVSFPNATSVGQNAFSSCSSLTSVSFPNATIIDNYIFRNCSNLTSVSIPKVTSISDQAFQGCSSLTDVSFPNATSIGDWAFYSCSSLTSVSFPNATSVGDWAFSSCSNLTEVSFPNATSIGQYAFYSCSGLTTIYVGTNTSTVCTLSNTNAFIDCTNLTNIYVPANLVDSYKSATNWSSYASKIKAIPTPMPIGGKIFYDAGDNGATYTFYDSNGNVINDTSISGLQSAVSYKVEGTPSFDRFYAVYPSILNSRYPVYWGFYYNADIKSSGGNIVNTGTAIGTGKTATQAILNYIDTYASNETASTSKPSSDISQASPNGYNLYKNCGTSRNYLWDVLRDANKNSLEGHDDWFIPSKDEMSQIASSGVISDITSSYYLWSSSADSSSGYAWYWYYFAGVGMVTDYRTFNYVCVVCRAF